MGIWLKQRTLVLAALLALTACSNAARHGGADAGNDTGKAGRSSSSNSSGGSGAAGAGKGGGNTGASAGRGASATGGKSANASGGSGGGSGKGSGGGGKGSGGSGGAGQSTVDAGKPLMPGDPGTSDVTFEIHSDADVHPISELVYGTNGCDGIDKTHQTACRSGGNRLTAYNWENNASNAGSDYQFQNDDLLSKSKTPGDAVKGMVQETQQNDAAAVVTIPIVDYVAADTNGGGDVRNSGSNYLQTRFKQNKPEKGSAFTTTPPTDDAYVYQDEFVAWMKQAVPGARVVFSLDNEPELWSSTHAEVHPKPVTYAELVQRNTDFARAAKAVWPEAEIAGFVSYGFNGFVNLQNASDANGRDFIEFYLDQMKAAESSAGMRLIDYLDLHWYSEAQGGGLRINDTQASKQQLIAAAVVTAREQAPRSLWDASYKESSWIVDYLGGKPIALVNGLHTKVEAHYPGTKLSFTEWNYGGGWHISGAIATADALGVFGREQVGLATYWGLYDDESYAMAGFRVYRNFDGAGAHFGDTSIQAKSSDQNTASVYASFDAADPSRVVIVAINKATADKKAGIALSHPTSFGSADVYMLTAGGGAALVKAAAVTATATNAFSYTMPAQSVSVLVPKR